MPSLRVFSVTAGYDCDMPERLSHVFPGLEVLSINLGKVSAESDCPAALINDLALLQGLREVNLWVLDGLTNLEWFDEFPHACCFNVHLSTVDVNLPNFKIPPKLAARLMTLRINILLEEDENYMLNLAALSECRMLVRLEVEIKASNANQRVYLAGLEHLPTSLSEVVLLPDPEYSGILCVRSVPGWQVFEAREPLRRSWGISAPHSILKTVEKDKQIAARPGRQIYL